MMDEKLIIGIIFLISIFIVIVNRFYLDWKKNKIYYENIKRWLSDGISWTPYFFISFFVFCAISIYYFYVQNNIGIIKFSIYILGLFLMAYAFLYFYFERKEYFTVSFFIIIFVCVFLIVITFNPDFITGMKISKMNMDTAKYYHSMISNLIIGFSGILGIGLPLLYQEQRSTWRKQVSFMFGGLMFYFIYVMYTIFLSELIQQIASLN
jgi:hypothetical protein